MSNLNEVIAKAREPMPDYLPTVDQCLFEPVYSPRGNWYCFANYLRGIKPCWIPVSFYTGANLYMPLYFELPTDQRMQLSTVKEGEFGEAVCLSWLKMKGIGEQ